MPCFDAQDSWSEREQRRINKLQSRNDQLMRCICDIDRSFQLDLTKLKPETKTVILEHRLFDRERFNTELKDAARKAASHFKDHEHTENVIRAVRKAGKKK